MDEKSRYEKISLWKNLAMGKSRYEIVLQVVYICATNLPFLPICVCIFLLIRVSQYPLAPCFPTCLTKRASMCHALEYQICNHPGMPSSRSFAPPLRSPQQVGLGGRGQMKLQVPDQVGCWRSLPGPGQSGSKRIVCQKTGIELKTFPVQLFLVYWLRTSSPK